MSFLQRRFVLVILAGTMTVVGAAGYVALAQQPKAADPPRGFANAIKKKMDAYVVLLRLRHDLFLKWKETGKFPDDKEASKALAGHGEYWQKQLKDGNAVLAGGMKGDYWDNVALIIFEAASEAAANEIAKNDPAVKAYVFQAQVRPFDVFFISNKFQTER